MASRAAKLFLKKKVFEINAIQNDIKLLSIKKERLIEKKMSLKKIYTEADNKNYETPLEMEFTNNYLNTILKKIKKTEYEIKIIEKQIENKKVIMSEHLAEKKGIEKYINRHIKNERLKETERENIAADETYARKHYYGS
ncbi:hypothetical protein [Nitrosophilus alvini]|uniref:hypothetical protein n=1 Tax=Nitrosophilus alvini TaxID=2714855 RepID=UPI00190A222D|nr:hypothetical protein [Nitrosophilus alvini]